jgi:cyclopropane fatty-acyl-phospholipid synthase-like methyltransferase
MKCQTCGNEYSTTCDYMQGRCPHHASMASQILASPYYTRYMNLFKSIKNFFTKGDCDCGHKH